MRKEQMFDWDRRYHRNCWERIKKIQKLLRENPDLKKLNLATTSGVLYIEGTSLDDLHTIRMALKKGINWGDRIVHKGACLFDLFVYYRGLDPYDFIEIKIIFPYDNLPEGILGDCYIKTKNEEFKSYISTTKSIVCPMGE